jgi:hypothetical protein
VAEIYDVEQPENDRQAQAEKGVERPVDQPQKELAEQGLWGNSQELEHVLSFANRIGEMSWPEARTSIMNGL